MIQIGLSYLAGLLTTLSPCVLPMIPMVMGSSLQKGKWTPIYLVLGLIIGFTTVGFLLSRFGSVLGLDDSEIRNLAAFFLIVFSAFLLSQKLQDFLSQKLSGLADFGNRASLNLVESRPFNAIFLGLLLGLIWSPCSGPTLGIAVGLASQEGAALQALTLMFVFALGAATPMVFLAYGFREVYLRNRNRVLLTAEKSKKLFGVFMILTALLILTGFDKSLESYIVDKLPDAWVDVTTRF